MDTGVKPKPRNQSSRSQVLNFIAVHGFDFKETTYRKPRRILMVVKRGSSALNDDHIWEHVLTEVSERLETPFPLRRLFHKSGEEIKTLEELGTMKFVVGTCGHNTETKQIGHSVPTNGNFGELPSSKFTATLVTEVEHLEKSPKQILIRRKRTSSPSSNAGVWVQVLSECGSTLHPSKPIRKIYKQNGEEIFSVEALENYTREGGDVLASTSDVLPSRLRRASACTEFISRSYRITRVRIQVGRRRRREEEGGLDNVVLICMHSSRARLDRLLDIVYFDLRTFLSASIRKIACMDMLVWVKEMLQKFLSRPI
jgi:hypothetical protein